MSTPYVALYASDYLADTAHLGLTEHGIYWRLLLHYYQHEKPFQNDFDKVCRIILANSPEEKRTVEYILTEFFILVRHEDGSSWWHNSRADRELSEAQHRMINSEMFKVSGSVGGKKSAEARRAKYGTAQPKKQAKNEPPFEPPLEPHTEAIFEGFPKQPEPDRDKEKEEGAKAPMSGKPDENIAAKNLLNYLNEIAGRTYKPVQANINLIRARLREYPVEELMRMLDGKVSEWRYDDKMHKYLRPETLFNATKCAQYIGEIGMCAEATQKTQRDWI